MSVRRWFVRLVLVVAVLASIATSAPLRWTLLDSVPIEELTLDDAAPTRTFAIHGSLTSQDALYVGQEVARLHVELQTRNEANARAAEVIVTFTLNAEVVESKQQVVGVLPGIMTSVDLELPAWVDCDAAPCSQDYTVTLQRRALVDDPRVDISGQIEIEATGDDSDSPPPGVALELDITDLGPAP